jgi:hypothetical protein
MLKTLILPILLMFHPVHVTLTSIDQAQGSDSLRVTFRMYYDDFLRDYKLYDPDFNLQKISGNQAFPADLLSKYFNDRVHIYINNKRLTGKLVAVDIPENYEIILSLLYKSDKQPKKFRIRNQVLTGLYDDQKNMIFFSINKYEAAMRLTQKHQQESCKLN